ncbi:MAG: MAE_28990/MAE_18760 family HEPN-like nuclease, partial [Microcystis aeruginosa]
LTQRNKIAHGKYLTIDYEEYINIYDLVIKLIRNFKDDLLNAAVTEQYKKVKSI